MYSVCIGLYTRMYTCMHAQAVYTLCTYRVCRLYSGICPYSHIPVYTGPYLDVLPTYYAYVPYRACTGPAAPIPKGHP